VLALEMREERVQLTQRPWLLKELGHTYCHEVLTSTSAAMPYQGGVRHAFANEGYRYPYVEPRHVMVNNREVELQRAQALSKLIQASCDGATKPFQD